MIATRTLPKGLNAAEKTIGLAVGIALLFGLEILFGASWEYASLIALYAATTAMAVVAAGGIATVMGFLVAFYASQHVFVSQFFKFFYGQRPDERLIDPLYTMAVENVFMLGLVAGLALYRCAEPRRAPLFPPIRDLVSLQRLALVGTILAVGRQMIMLLGGSSSFEAGSAFGPLRQLAFIDSVAFSAAIAVAVIESGGKKMTNRFVWFIVVPQLSAGLLTGGRMSMASPIIAMAITAASFGYRFRFRHALIAAGALYVFVRIISPFGLAIRSEAQSDRLDFAGRINYSLSTLTNVIVDPEKYKDANEVEQNTIPPEKYPTLYFLRDVDSTSNTLERFALFKYDDLIIDDARRTGLTGWTTITPAFPRMVPSLFGFDKSMRPGGNMLAHRIRGILAPDDYGTAITTGMTGDAFSSFGWPGVVLVPLIFGFALPYLHRLVISLELKGNIFALSMLLGLAWNFSELSISGVLLLPTYNLYLLILGLFVVTRAAKFSDFRYLHPRRLPAFPDEAVPAESA